MIKIYMKKCLNIQNNIVKNILIKNGSDNIYYYISSIMVYMIYNFF